MRARSHSSLPKPLRLFILVLPGLTFLSWLDAAFSSIRSGHLDLGDLWIPFPGFDFYDYTPRFLFLHHPQFFTVANSFPWIYPAPAIFVLYPFYLIASPTRWHLSYALFALFALGLCFLCAQRLGTALHRRGLTWLQITLLLGSVSVLGWPLYFALQRGNIEALLWVGIAAAVALIARRRYTAGALVLGLIGSVKTYPLLLVGLLLLQKRLRASALALATAGVTTVLALRFLEPDVADAWHRIRTGVAEWTTITTGQYFASGIGPDHSFLGLLRQVTLGAILKPTHALPICLAVAGVVTTAVFFLRVRTLPLLNQTLFILCAAILLPPTSYDYTLLLLFIPFGWLTLVCAEQHQRSRPTHRLLPFFLLFAVAFAPLTFLQTHGPQSVRFEGPFRSLVLLVLMGYAAVVPVPPLLSETAEP